MFAQKENIYQQVSKRIELNVRLWHLGKTDCSVWAGKTKKHVNLISTEQSSKMIIYASK